MHLRLEIPFNGCPDVIFSDFSFCRWFWFMVMNVIWTITLAQLPDNPNLSFRKESKMAFI